MKSSLKNTTEINLNGNWYILQDVHDAGEKLGLYREDSFLTQIGPQMSEWEPLPELKHLQLLFAENPYWGRELRYFNDAPWWYKNEFSVPEEPADRYTLAFTNVDYYCKVWLNGTLIGEHEGYSIPFSFDVTSHVRPGCQNRLIVKVWSPWDTEVDHDNQKARTTVVLRNMVKGTYEHSDTFVQRDVNPVGIYGTVALKCSSIAWFERRPEFSYVLSDDLRNAALSFRSSVTTADGAKAVLHMECMDCLTGETVFRAEKEIAAGGSYEAQGIAEQIHLWSTWDQGTPYTYRIRIWLEDAQGNLLDEYTERTGFRKIEIERDETKTRFVLNGRPFYVRGTSYFPDNYVSAMNRDRYRRDLLAMKACGFNMIRIHVHVDLPEFHELCTEIGLGILQDSEYNWAHPFSDEFAQRFIEVYLQTVDLLKVYPSVFCWITMNEPGLLDTTPTPGGGRRHCRSMDINPGPALYKAVCEHDPTRPVIKGSFCDDDPYSGDSHNYTGSLAGEKTRYRDIYGTVEKLNTEYGFDAPPCAESLRKAPPVFRRLQALVPSIPELQDYQYRLLKYFTEHYRMQKYSPNSGYVQFLFSDISPASYYGLYDWWGIPKKGLLAMLESNMPTGIFLKYQDQLDAIYAVSDLPEDTGTCTAVWHITDTDGHTLCKGEKEIFLGRDALVPVTELNKRFDGVVNVHLVLKQGDKIIASNHYEDVFHMPEHPKGHPGRMSHELGVRLYNC